MSSRFGPLKQGDTRADGKVFYQYNSKSQHGEQWFTPEAYQNRCLINLYHTTKTRSKKKNVPFDIDVAYLHELYPKDGLCPALKIKLEWGGDRSTSPSLDRIKPHLGYVRENVQFLSGLANRIKTDATTEQIISVANYLKDLTAKCLPSETRT